MIVRGSISFTQPLKMFPKLQNDVSKITEFREIIVQFKRNVVKTH